jgi:hypothetical protein
MRSKLKNLDMHLFRSLLRHPVNLTAVSGNLKRLRVHDREEMDEPTEPDSDVRAWDLAFLLIPENGQNRRLTCLGFEEFDEHARLPPK